MTDSDDYIRGNKEAWEEAYEHRRPDWGQDVAERLRSERFPFFDPEVVAELEQVEWPGKSVGQFCCNNGRELLSIMKQGAKEGVGFDIAENQVAFANRTAAALGLPCNFIATDILQIDDTYRDRFDFLLITIGALCWFRDLPPFFEVVARCVRRGGTVLIHEQHPLTNMLGQRGDDNYDERQPGLLLNSYFRGVWTGNDGMPYLTGTTYPSRTFTSYTHSLTEIISSALDAGLAITRFAEFERDISGGEFPALENRGIPLSFLLRLRRE